MLIDGKKIAAEVRSRVASEVATLAEAPGLATILVGDDPASAVYVRNKRRAITAAGMRDFHRALPGSTRYGVVVAAVAGHVTPVPGGVGPMTIAMLLANTLTAATH